MARADLITVDEVAVSAASAVGDFNDVAHEIERIITDVTAQVERYLDRTLIAEEHKQALTAADWKPNKYEPYGSGGSVSFTGAYDPRASHTLRRTGRHTDTKIAQADEWPVVEPITTGLAVGPKPHLLKIDTENADAGEFTYWAGYLRPDQSASDFAGLTDPPDRLPGDIRRVAIALAIYELVRATDGLIGRSRVQTSGPVSITVDGSDRGFPKRELARLDSYKRYV